ncbi:MAG: SNF2-related protein [Nitrospirota bacterium]|nr:SNF2-related protein [Nitrospirota bacterium]
MLLTEEATRKKKTTDPFTVLLTKAVFTRGFEGLNVLVIGKLNGCRVLAMSGANVHYFTDVDRIHTRWKPIDRLDDYRELLRDKFDFVISREYNSSHLEFCNSYGGYLTRVLEMPKNAAGIFNKDFLCALLGKDMYGQAELSDSEFSREFQERIKLLIPVSDESIERVYLPNIDRICKVDVQDAVTVTHKGIRCSSEATSGLLTLYNKTINVYNPLYTTYTGVIDAYQKFPVTAFVSLDKRIEVLKEFGFDVNVEPQAKVLSERQHEKYRYLTTPLMPVLPQQTLAYIKEGEHTALNDIPRLGINKGQRYKLHVGWKKRNDGDVKRGFMTVSVNDHTLWEDDDEDIKDFIRAFGLPVVNSIEEQYPAVLSGWKKKAGKMFPEFQDFQLQDVALAATKPSVYFAHDRGLGKTFMSAAWAKLRGYKRVLVAVQNQYVDKWLHELKKFGFNVEALNDWPAVRKLKEKIKAGIKNNGSVFYISSFEFLGHESDLYLDPWTCIEYGDNKGLKAVVREIKSRKCPSCGKTVKQARKVCPLCGSRNYTGRYCFECQRPTYTYKRKHPLTPEKCRLITEEAKEKKGSSGTYPAYKKLKKLFSCVIIDEAQLVKNKNTLRSTAVRSLHAKGRLLVTANLMKNYPYELFWPVSWLLGFNNPMFPYQYLGGFSFFEKQFGTQIIKGYKADDSGRSVPVWRKTPEVSNLTILWKLLAPFMVRRLKNDVSGTVSKNIEAVTIDMDEEQELLYQAVLNRKLEELATELEKDNPDARIIGANLWSLKAASTIPVAERYLPPVGMEYHGVWPKILWIADKIREIQAKGEKVLVFSTLVDMADYVRKTLNNLGIKNIHIKQGTKKRFEIIQRFNTDSSTALISSPELIGRSYDIDGANNVIFTDVGWTPEEHEQAMDRAHRLISRKPVKVYFLLSRKTIDEHMFELIVQKGEAIKNVLDRRAIYQPADAIQEAIQVQVARRLMEEKPAEMIIKRSSFTAKTVEDSHISWPAIEPVVHYQQINLF